MAERKEYTLTQPDFEEMMAISGVNDSDVEAAWEWLGQKLGFDWKTMDAGRRVVIEKDGASFRVVEGRFSAVPLEIATAGGA